MNTGGAPVIRPMLGSRQVETSQRAAENPSHKLRAVPISLLLCSFPILWYGHHSTAAILYWCYCVCHEFRPPCPRILLPKAQPLCVCRGPSLISDVVCWKLCFTRFTIPVQSHKCLKWVQLIAISPDSFRTDVYARVVSSDLGIDEFSRNVV